MLRRLGCLGLVVSILLVVVGGWFAYQVVLHISDARTVDDRLGRVTDAWTADDTMRRQAASGEGGLLATGLGGDPFQEMGAVAVAHYSVSGTRLELVVMEGVCDPPALTVDTRSTGDLVVVLVHPVTSWLPDVGAALRSINPQSCPAIAVERVVPVTLERPLGSRVVVDAVPGTSVARG